MKVKLLIMVTCATPLIIHGMQTHDTKKSKSNYISAIRISSVKNILKRRIIALKHRIEDIPEDLRGTLNYFETSYTKIRNHYSKGHKAIDKKTYRQLDKGLRHLEKEADINRRLKPHIKSTKDLQDFVFNFNQLPDFNEFMYQVKCWASIKQFIKYASLMSIAASLGYKAKKLYEHYSQKPQESSELEQADQIDKEEQKTIIT